MCYLKQLSVSGIKLPTQSHILKVDDAGGSKARFSVIFSTSCGSKEGRYKIVLECYVTEAAYPGPVSINYDIFLN